MIVVIGVPVVGGIGSSYVYDYVRNEGNLFVDSGFFGQFCQYLVWYFPIQQDFSSPTLRQLRLGWTWKIRHWPSLLWVFFPSSPTISTCLAGTWMIIVESVFMFVSSMVVFIYIALGGVVGLNIRRSICLRWVKIHSPPLLFGWC